MTEPTPVTWSTEITPLSEFGHLMLNRVSGRISVTQADSRILIHGGLLRELLCPCDKPHGLKGAAVSLELQAPNTLAGAVLTIKAVGRTVAYRIGGAPFEYVEGGIRVMCRTRDGHEVWQADRIEPVVLDQCPPATP